MGTTVENAGWSDSYGFLSVPPRARHRNGVVCHQAEATLEESRAAPRIAGNVQGIWEQPDSED